MQIYYSENDKTWLANRNTFYTLVCDLGEDEFEQALNP